MVTLENPNDAPVPPVQDSSGRAKTSLKSGGWLVPGEEAWEIREPQSSSDFPLVRVLEDATVPPPSTALVALPATLVICQLFWLESTDEKAVPDLLQMQCERRALLRQGEVWKHRIVRNDGDRSLVQVLILANALPGLLDVEGAARFEALPRCLELPPRAVCLLRSLGTMMLIITDDTGVLYFQSLPHQSLTTECRRDVQSVIWMAMGLQWISTPESLLLIGTWTTSDVVELKTLGIPVKMQGEPLFALPTEAMELTPKSVQHLRALRHRQKRVRLVALALAAVYAVFLSVQIVSAALTSLSNTRLQARLDALMPAVTDMQGTARRLDALNPALDTKTYPLEVLRRIMANLPESGVRLTRFDIIGDRIEIAGESTTAREAFDFLRAIQVSDALKYISWEDPPQPVPLPNDTARFSIQGTITGAYRDAEES